MNINEPTLDNDEKEIREYVHTATPYSDHTLQAQLEKAAREHLTKTERVSLRVLPSDLEEIKLRAARTGIPYQSLIGALIHQYATGQIHLNT